MPLGHTELPYRKFSGNQFIGETPRNTIPREDTKYPKVLLLPQYQVEEALRHKLAELGVNVEWATELIEFTQIDNGFTCRLENPNWTEELTCDYMIACDGGKSTTRKKLGINFVGETHQEEQLWVGDVEVEGFKPDAWYNWLSPEFGLAFALFPFKGSNSWQLQAVVPRDNDGNVPIPTLEGFRQLFKERTQMEGVSFTNSTWQSIYRVNVRRAEQYRVGNAFIAGDAAHVHSIAGGMGMNTGIQDAYNLGWKLAAVIHGEAGDDLLNTYAEERIPIADWLLRTTSERQQVMLKAATAGKGAFETLATSDTTQLNLNYRDSPLTVKSNDTESKLQAGDRAPDVELADRTWLSDQLKGTQWRVLVINDKAPVETIEGIKIVNSNDKAIVSAYGIDKGWVIIRPDGYIAAIVADWEKVKVYFQQFYKSNLPK
ncbi:hypothetical protein RG47T_5114 [Mucilaginibacter polytrichastri]|uniref:FAD-binding domain-containing protein n=2 Tax=Mucilaginibacter polytrichastri TaxID=1302689 RepID=A0A1Q6A6K8_9SPHI|nr:hypothetical protein RG47T_5114 [Mucilaginibacter polytrichastri]